MTVIVTALGAFAGLAFFAALAGLLDRVAYKRREARRAISLERRDARCDRTVARSCAQPPLRVPARRAAVRSDLTLIEGGAA